MGGKKTHNGGVVCGEIDLVGRKVFGTGCSRSFWVTLCALWAGGRRGRHDRADAISPPHTPTTTPTPTVSARPRAAALGGAGGRAARPLDRGNRHFGLGKREPDRTAPRGT